MGFQATKIKIEKKNGMRKENEKSNQKEMLLSALYVHIEPTYTQTHTIQSRPNKSGFNLKALDNYLGKMKMAI